MLKNKPNLSIFSLGEGPWLLTNNNEQKKVYETWSSASSNIFYETGKKQKKNKTKNKNI